MDRIRVLRIIEYVGPRDAVEKQIRMSLQGTRLGAAGAAGLSDPCVITAVTLGVVPEVIRPTYTSPLEDFTVEVPKHGA
jgi:hypothetical protein